MNDALEILNELDDIIKDYTQEAFDRLCLIEEYIAQKRTEFEPAKGDCAG